MRTPIIVERLDYRDERWPDGTVFHGPPGGLRAADTPDRRRWQTPASWSAETVAEAEDIRRAAWSFCGGRPGTLAGAAMKVWRRFMPEEQTRSVKTRYRAIWRRTHVGPMVAIRGDYPHLYHYDRRKAYLDSLRRPLPLGRTAQSFGGRAATRLVCSERFEGAAYCRVRVPMDFEFGPLPVTAKLTSQTARGGSSETSRVLWPSATTVEGVWSAPELRAALEVGCEVEKVHEAVSVRVAPWLLPLYDHILKALQGATGSQARVVKAAYQTGWLKLRPAEWSSWVKETVCFRGRWFSRLSPVPPREDVDALWRQTRISPTMLVLRPDVSRYVSGYNIGEMARAICGAGAGVVAAHIDSIHSQHPIKTGPDIGDFRLVNQGPCTYHSPGHYQYEGGSVVGGVTFESLSAGWLRAPSYMNQDGQGWTMRYDDAPRWSIFDRRFDQSGWPRCGYFKG